MENYISEEDKQMLMNLTRDDITLELLEDFFAETVNKKARFQCNDKLLLKKDEYYNSEAIETTIGRVIFNKCLLEPVLIKHLGFQNKQFNKKVLYNLDGEVIKLFTTGVIDSMQIIYDYFDQCNWLAYAPTYFLVSSLNADMFIIDEGVKKRKEELIEENKEAILNNDVTVVNKIENELLDMSKEVVKDRPGYMIYDSGARGDFSNNYKNSVIMRGCITDFTDSSRFNTSLASLVDGIPKEDFEKYANILTAGTYARVA